jgi:hypothetical protein
MRRLISIAAFALVLTVPLWAQRGGHGGGGGMRGGGFAGHVGGGHSMGGMHSAGMRSGAGVSHGSSHSSNNGNWHGSSWNHGSHSHNVHVHTFHNCFGAFCGHSAFNSPWWGGGWGWGWGWYSPWLWSSWDDQDRRFDEDYYRQYELANQWNQQSIAEQRMRDREDAGDQDAYAPRSSYRSSAPEVASQPSEPAPATVLVFRDRRQQEVQNYAIVGQTLWAFSAGKSQKIPLANLDVAATEKANDDRGVTFRVPGTAEGQ